MKYPRTFAEAQAVLATARRPAGKPIGHNTRLVALGDGAIGVRFHTIIVVTFKPDGTIVLDSGGWRTFTTRDRINKCIPFGLVWQKAFVWYYGLGEKTWVFADGMTLGERKVVSGADLFVPAKKRDPFPNKVKRFARGFVEALRVGKIGPPDLGDCLFCRTVLVGADHLVSHVVESYYVPSLVVRALDEFRASYCARVFVIHAMQKTLNDNLWYGSGEEQTEELIRRYVLRHTGYAV